MFMTRLACSIGAILGICLIAIDGNVTTIGARAAESPHAYFDTLVASSAHWKSYSLRDQAQLLTYKTASSRPPDVNYLYPNDPDPRRQDAAKVVIPDFPQIGGATLAVSIDANTTQIPASGSPPFAPRQSIKIDNEIMTVVGKDGTVATVQRGQHGTTASPHSAGATIRTGTNNLQNQVWLPMGTEDGNSYLTTWDAWYGREVRRTNTGLTNWKTFQFRKGASKPSLAFEVRTRFDGGSDPWKLSLDPNTDIGAVDMRTYLGTIGPEVTRQEPISPMTGTFRVRAETWTRYWMLLDQRVGDWDLVSLWVADEHTEPVQVLDRVPVEVGTTPPTIHSFQLEFNTSTDEVAPNRGPLVIYVRNVVMLRNVANPANLLKRPGGSTPPPPFSAPTPVAPVNLRVVKGS